MGYPANCLTKDIIYPNIMIVNTNFEERLSEMPPYKDAKRGTWYVAFYYKSWNGERKHAVKRGFRTKGEAVKYEKDFLDMLQTSSNIPFGALVAHYLEYLTPRIKPTTMSTKKFLIEQKILPYFESLRLCDITPVHVTNWQNELLKLRDKNGKAYAPTYLKSVNAQLSAIFNFAMKQYRLSQNPCHIVGSIGKKEAEEMQFWTKEEFDQFIKSVRSPVFHLFFDTLFYTGARCGEALALTADDILTVPEKAISITKNFAVIDGQEVILTPKSEASNRKVTIPDFLYDEFVSYIQSLCDYQSNDRIFYFTKAAVTHEIKRAIKESGVKMIRVHDLRHSHASMLIHLGVNIKQVSKRLGHSSVKVTWDRYAHLYPEKNVELIKTLNDLGIDPDEKAGGFNLTDDDED